MGSNQFAVYDIEASDWKKFLAIGYYDIFNEKYKYFLSMESYIDFLFSKQNKQTTHYAHFGGIYDALFIFDIAFRLDLVIDGIILSGRRILSFKLRKGRKTQTFIDSSGLFPFSLHRLGISFDVKHKKLDEDVTLFKKVTPKMLKYMEWDCRCLAEALKKYSETEYVNEIGLSLTRSGQSFKILKEFFLKDFPTLPRSVEFFARQALYGGRTEIFEPSFISKNKKENLNVYDFNSLYPSVMFKYKFPAGFSHLSSSLELDEFSISEVLIKCPLNLNYPFLPLKAGGKTLFPVGTFRGHYTNVELKKAISLGYEVLKVYKTAVFHDGGFIFKKFVDTFYKKRLKAKKAKDGLLNIFYKDVLNHPWGRIVMNKVRPSLSFDIESGGKIHSKFKIDDYEIRAYEFSKEIFADTNVAMGLFVPMYGRLELYEAMEKIDFNIHYCDTDSLFTTSDINNTSDDDLGALAHEKSYSEWYALQPKAYAGVKLDKKMEVKVKGIKFKDERGKPYSPIDAGLWSLKDFEDSLEGEIKIAKLDQYHGLAGLKVAMKKGDFLTKLPNNKKGINKLDEKRIWYKDNQNNFKTIPHVVEYNGKGKNVVITMGE